MFHIDCAVDKDELFLYCDANAAASYSKTWVGGSGDWNTTSNWSGGTLPGASDDVLIPTGVSVTPSSGSHTELMKTCPIYQRLNEVQQQRLVA